MNPCHSLLLALDESGFLGRKISGCWRSAREVRNRVTLRTLHLDKEEGEVDTSIHPSVVSRLPYLFPPRQFAAVLLSQSLAGQHSCFIKAQCAHFPVGTAISKYVVGYFGAKEILYNKRLGFASLQDVLW